MPRTSDARQRMIESAAVLFRERGVQGTSFSEVLEHSGAPRGSVYHHFRGGKTELAEAATRWAGEYILAATVAALAEHDPVAAIDSFRDWWTAVLRSNGYNAGCVIAAGALEGEREPAVRAAAAVAFTRWEDALADALEARGVAAERARSLATLVIASLEGAVVLSRAHRSSEPLERAAAELQRAVAAGLRP
jgi:AcrR family transcriptional regulator